MSSINQLVPLGWEAQLHRETYIAVLHGQLRQRGAKQKFAAKVGITPQYLSYLLDPYNHRTPAPVTAERIARALVMSEHEREHVLEHMVLASEQETQARQTLKQELPHIGIEAALCEIRVMNRATHFGQNPQRVRAERKMTAQLCKLFLSQLDPWQFPLEYAEVSLILNELNAVLDHYSRALYHAKRARYVLSVANGAQARLDAARMDGLLTNATRLEAVAYAGLGLPQLSYRLLNEAERTSGARRNPAAWLPHVFRDKLNALSCLPRSSLAEAEALALQGVRAMERAVGDQTPLLTLMLERSLSGVYLHLGRVNEAALLLDRLAGDMETVPEIGTLHRMLVLKDYAHALWCQGKRAKWAEVLCEAVELGIDAGLWHPLGTLRERYRQLPAEAFTMLTPAVQAQIRPSQVPADGAPSFV